jgi:hypothetical protein
MIIIGRKIDSEEENAMQCLFHIMISKQKYARKRFSKKLVMSYLYLTPAGGQKQLQCDERKLL